MTPPDQVITANLNERQKAQAQTNKDLEVFLGKPFWIDDAEEHERLRIETNEQCCFNHIIGRPEKKGQKHGMFDYEISLFNSMMKWKRHCILKSRGLGITEFTLRFIAWLCVRDNTHKGADIGIIVGPNLKLAYKLIRRLKRLFESRGIYFDSAVTSVEINGVNVEAFPSNNPDSFRGLEKPLLFLVDEADFYPHGQEEATKSAVEGASSKSDPWILFVSTPKKPNKFMDIFVEDCKKVGQPTTEHKNRYYLHLLPYTIGLGKIYTQEEIDDAMGDPSFEQEYNLKFKGQIGNIFSEISIDMCQTNVGYDPDNLTEYGARVMGIDPSLGSGHFGVCIVQYVNGKIQVIHADEYQSTDYQDIMNTIWGLIKRFNPINKYIIDPSVPAVVYRLKVEMGEDPHWKEVKQRMIKDHMNWIQLMKVVPLAFGSQEGIEMLGNAKFLVDKGQVSIHKNFNKLITSLQTAKEVNGKFKKEDTSFNDIFDAFRLALSYFKPAGELINKR